MPGIQDRKHKNDLVMRPKRIVVACSIQQEGAAAYHKHVKQAADLLAKFG